MSNPAFKFKIHSATTSSHFSSICTLFTTYATWLSLDLTFQNFAHELAHLPGSYASPGGCLLLATLESGEDVGCIALRPLIAKPTEEGSKGKICEVKRLFLTRSARGLGIGRALVEAVIAEARKRGYEEMKLDTLPRMVGARRLYENVGFVECERYYETPVEGTVFMRKKL